MFHRIAFLAGLLSIMAAGLMALPKPAAAQEQCFMCMNVLDWLWHSDGGCAGSQDIRQDLPGNIHYSCIDPGWFGCVAAHTRCAWVIDEFDEENGVLVASSECGGSTTFALT